MLKRSIIIAAAVASFSVGAQASSIDSLKGIEAETLNATEMQEIQGMITFTELIAAIKASSWYKTNTASGDKLIAYLTSLYTKYPKYFDYLLKFVKLPSLAQ
jgi:hypothetical protein